MKNGESRGRYCRRRRRIVPLSALLVISCPPGAIYNRFPLVEQTQQQLAAQNETLRARMSANNAWIQNFSNNMHIALCLYFFTHFNMCVVESNKIFSLDIGIHRVKIFPDRDLHNIIGLNFRHSALFILKWKF
jgi:hypothetical protein